MAVVAASREATGKTHRLGRYEIVKHLAQGGMADVLLARTTGIEGFERHVVIKRIRAEQARDARYVEMFLDEARLAASLHHHNIAQVNDIGEEATETVIAALGSDPGALTREAADLLYHLLVLLECRQVALRDVLAELEARMGTSGLAEKVARGGPRSGPKTGPGV